jgi:hypothetical protein
MKVVYRVPDIETTDNDGKPVKLTDIEVHVMGEDDGAPGITGSIDQTLSAADIKAEANRLIDSGEMPSFDKLSAAIAETRAKYRDRILAARGKRNTL